jgi:hypothetical protein
MIGRWRKRLRVDSEGDTGLEEGPHQTGVAEGVSEKVEVRSQNDAVGGRGVVKGEFNPVLVKRGEEDPSRVFERFMTIGYVLIVLYNGREVNPNSWVGKKVGETNFDASTHDITPGRVEMAGKG